MNDLERRALLGVAGIGALAALSSSARGGPLNPPAGPVAPTSKPLAEIEPRIAINATNTPGNVSNTFRITQPGSYYLTGNITGDVGKNGIGVEASDVTIDLNGYALNGVATSLNGIANTAAGLSNIRVTNGTIRNWGIRAIALSSAVGGSIERVRVLGNSTASAVSAVLVFNDFILTDCLAEGNVSGGLAAGINCVLTRCIASGNGGSGIGTGVGAVISDCASRGNTGTGIGPGAGSIVRACVSSGNVNGIDGTTQLRIEGCSIIANSGIGISMGTSCEISGNTVIGSGVGASAGAIQVGSGCLVRGNFCKSTAVGIQATSSDNTIIANHLATHTNTYIIPAGNHFGPFVVSGASAGAISGNAASPGTMGATDPYVNFID